MLKNFKELSRDQLLILLGMVCVVGLVIVAVAVVVAVTVFHVSAVSVGGAAASMATGLGGTAGGCVGRVGPAAVAGQPASDPGPAG